MVFDWRIIPLLCSLHLGSTEIVAADETAPIDKLPAQSTPSDGTHDMVLLLPNGPLHLRVEVTDSGKSLKRLREEYMRKLAKTLDTDQDGKISRRETAKHPLFVSGRRFAGNKFLDSLRSEKNYTETELGLAVERAAGQLLTFRQNNSLTDQDLSVFRVLDENESGLIERVEMRTAPVRLSKRDLDFDQCITLDEFLSQPDSNAMNAIVAVNNSEPPESIRSELLRDATEPILAPRLVRRYDTDRDAKLSVQELGWTKEAHNALDGNGDQLLSVQELAGISKSEPDLWLSIDLSVHDDTAMRLIGGRMAAKAKSSRADSVRLSSAEMSLSVGYSRHDSQEEANRNARAAFNAIDLDTNGYIDRNEIAEHQRFERYLFDAMDANDDSRVFADEMLQYVSAYTEPASTTCQVTLFDTGNGYFQMLDQNADGRISIRELRKTEDNLLAQSNEQQAINPSRLSKSFRINIQRGGVSLFGRVDRPEAELPTAILPTPIGPVWFQRMDRNGDGDLIWDEFLGPREVFHQLDRDQDGLIDAQEAGQFSK